LIALISNAHPVLRPLRVPERGTLSASTLGLDEHCRKTRIHQDKPGTIAALRRPQPLHVERLAAIDALRWRGVSRAPGVSPLHDVKKSASR
jgi:hypothetical protein